MPHTGSVTIALSRFLYALPPGQITQKLCGVNNDGGIGFTELYPDERQASAQQFLRNALRYFQSLGVTIQCVITGPN
jgi:hypothetical protein